MLLTSFVNLILMSYFLKITLKKSEQRLRNILITDLLAAFYILRKTEIGYMKEILINIMYADQ